MYHSFIMERRIFMFDAHYDLLSIAYVCYLKNDFQKLEKYAKYFHQNNVKAVMANLYFMTKEEMRDELHPNYYKEDISVLEMFKIAKIFCEKYIPKDIQIIYSIEGCDYIKTPDELEQLYKEGLRSIMLTWNEGNKYGSGNREDYGLTLLGKEFIKKAIDLGIGIDLSHANQKTFYDIIDLAKEQRRAGKKVVCYASHSNSRNLCERVRNLYDEQLDKIKEIGGIVGVFALKSFCTAKKDLTDNEYRNCYLEQINYMVEHLGIDKVMISTDDMKFIEEYDEEYGRNSVFSYETVLKEVQELLKNKYSSEEIEKICYRNSYEKIIKPLIIEGN